MRQTALITALAVMAMVTGAIAQTPQQAAEWQKVIDAAKAEGKVTMYSGQVGVPYHHEIAKLFTAKYGIPVETLEARASELQERIRLEQVTNRVKGDFSHNGGSSAVLLERMGTFQEHGYLPNLEKLQDRFKSSGRQFSFFVQRMGIAVNTRIPEAERPKGWLDLLNPRWKGRILSDDFRALGSGSAFFNVTYRFLGREFLEKLATQNIVFSRAVRDSPRRVARGEYDIYIPLSLPETLLNEGLPLQTIIPQEGTPYVTYDAAVFTGAPHPNAARLLLDFFISEEAQMIYVRSGRGPTIKGLDDKVPENVAPLIRQGKLMDKPDADRTEELLKLAEQMYKGP